MEASPFPDPLAGPPSGGKKSPVPCLGQDRSHWAASRPHSAHLWGQARAQEGLEQDRSGELILSTQPWQFTLLPGKAEAQRGQGVCLEEHSSRASKLEPVTSLTNLLHREGETEKNTERQRHTQSSFRRPCSHRRLSTQPHSVPSIQQRHEMTGNRSRTGTAVLRGGGAEKAPCCRHLGKHRRAHKAPCPTTTEKAACSRRGRRVRERLLQSFRSVTSHCACGMQEEKGLYPASASVSTTPTSERHSQRCVKRQGQVRNRPAAWPLSKVLLWHEKEGRRLARGPSGKALSPDREEG